MSRGLQPVLQRNGSTVTYMNVHFQKIDFVRETFIKIEWQQIQNVIDIIFNQQTICS